MKENFNDSPAYVTDKHGVRLISNDTQVKQEAPQMDWQQVVLNGGPPCFAQLEDEAGWYCGRAQRWEGHDGDHKFVSLANLLATVRREVWQEAIRVAQVSAKKSQVAGLNIAAAEILIRRLERASAKKCPVGYSYRAGGR